MNFQTFVEEREEKRRPWLFSVPVEKARKRKRGPGRGWWAPPKGTHVKSTLSKGARKAIGKYTRSILAFGKSTGKEAATAIDKEGDPIGTKLAVGSRDEVDIAGLLTGEEHVIIHNHPSSNSFSAPDIALLFTTKAQHIVAAGHDGTLYRLSKTPNTRALTSELVVISYIQNRYNKTMMFLMSEFSSKVKSGELSRDVAQREHTHQIVTKVAETYGLDYERTIP